MALGLSWNILLNDLRKTIIGRKKNNLMPRMSDCWIDLGMLIEL